MILRGTAHIGRPGRPYEPAVVLEPRKKVDNLLAKVAQAVCCMLNAEGTGVV